MPHVPFEPFYPDATGWHEGDLASMKAYVNRLIQYLGPTPTQEAANPNGYGTRVARQRMGRRDAEFAALDPERMNEPSRHELRTRLVETGRYEAALERFPNLRGL